MHNNLPQNKPLKPQSVADQPIGVLDSGVGGISVLRHIHALLPHEDLIYFADSKHAPYGNKTQAQIERRVFAAAKFLLTHGAKALVIACNTATAHAAQSLRDKYAFLELPIIGMEPAVKPAAAVTKNGIVGVLVTTGTLKSAQFAGLLESYGRNVKVVTQACVGLVECIERGELTLNSTKELLKKYLSPLLQEGADTIVLGCTHYPFVRPLIEEILLEQRVANVAIIDTGAAVAKQLQKKLADNNLLETANKPANISLWTNSQAENAAQVIEQLWGEKVETKCLV